MGKSVLNTATAYCAATLVPVLGKALGSRIRIARGSASSSRTWRRNSAMTASSSHLPTPTKVWIGLRWTPASTALGAVEAGQRALQEGGEPVLAASNLLGGHDDVSQEDLGVRVVQERHGGPS